MNDKSMVKISGVANAQLEAIRRIAEQATPEDEIRWRDGRGGQKQPYTDPAYVIRTLNGAFGWDWDFVADSEELLLNNGQPFEVKVRGTLTVRLNGQAVIKTQFGCQPVEMKRDGSAPVSIGDCYKGAASDALKKCASLLGVALDLYDSDSPVHNGGAQKLKEAPVRKPDARDVPRVVLHGARLASGGKQPRPGGLAGQIVSFAEDVLKWDASRLHAKILEELNIDVNPDLLYEAIKSLPDAGKQRLIAALKAAKTESVSSITG